MYFAPTRAKFMTRRARSEISLDTGNKVCPTCYANHAYICDSVYERNLHASCANFVSGFIKMDEVANPFPSPLSMEELTDILPEQYSHWSTWFGSSLNSLMLVYVYYDQFVALPRHVPIVFGGRLNNNSASNLHCSILQASALP